jgi:hypothetical protein
MTTVARDQFSKIISQVLDPAWILGAYGQCFVAGDADQNDMVTGQTSFANTTPTFMIDVPEGITVIPLFVDLSQAGTVAGGDIELIIEIDNADRYGSGGTSETVLCTRTTGGNPNVCAVYSGATANAGFGQRVFSAKIAPDVSPAEGILPGPLWVPPIPYFLVGPAGLLVYSWAGTTGPTWLWSIGWAEINSASLPGVR